MAGSNGLITIGQGGISGLADSNVYGISWVATADASDHTFDSQTINRETVGGGGYRLGIGEVRKPRPKWFDRHYYQPLYQMKTRYTEISGTADQIARFCKRIGRDVDEIAAAVLEVMGLGDMPVVFRISLRGCAKDVQEVFFSIYNQPFSGNIVEKHRELFDKNRVAFCSKSQGKIFISVADATARVVSHEMTHHVLNIYFSDPIPTVLHELIAQTVEERVCKKYSRWF